MPCYSPLHGYRSKSVNPATGKRSIVFSPSEGFTDFKLALPCGQCIGCRLERSRQWAMRCMHEASLYKNNCFITLTYAPEKLPPSGSLQLDHFQKFMKRLRFKFAHPFNNKFNIQQKNIRFFMCGEYGELNTRPHYHACLFNFDFPDRVLWKPVRGNNLYISETLHELWDFGYHSIGDVTFDSAAYVARYITKKITGSQALDHYCHYNTDGEIIRELKPEFTTMSRRPGIGKGWFQKYQTDVYPGDHVIVRGKELKSPKYYDKIYDQVAPAEMRRIKLKREALAKKNPDARNAVTLFAKEFIKKTKAKLLKRSYETNDT